MAAEQRFGGGSELGFARAKAAMASKGRTWGAWHYYEVGEGLGVRAWATGVVACVAGLTRARVRARLELGYGPDGWAPPGGESRRGEGGAGRERGKWASYARLSGRKGEREKGKKGKGEGSWAEPKG